jgi:predicted ATP-dependent endonuclease of OLD family
MTKRFTEWWEQRRHAFRYQSDGDYFRVWVSDDLDPSEIELDQRSQGMQYFFSFFLVFLVEATGQHANSVLLLDEPGNSLHGTAQAKIVEFLEKIAEEGQVIYSTHSPFMIDGNHLERVRAVFEDETSGATSVSEDVWPKDRDALFPLQAALGYELVQSLFISRRQVIVEGMTDYWLLKSLAEGIAARGVAGLDPEIVITPAAGASKALPLAAMMTGHGVELAALFDGDAPGRADGKKLLERLLHDTKRVLYVSDFVEGNDTAEIEDLFGEAYYLEAVRLAYPDVNLAFTADELAMPNVVDRLSDAFGRLAVGSFEKWRVASALRDKMLEDASAIPDDVVARAERLFGALNAAFGD